MNERKIYSLLQLANAIKRRIDEATHGASFWIKAEIASIKVAKHAYLELVQHKDGQKVAVMKAAIWSSTLERIQNDLGNENRNIMKDGVEILFRAKTNYHLVYGLSLVVEEIDLSFNISMLERRKQETIAALKNEGLFDLNRFVPLPLVIQRIALIASVGTAAYGDFMKHLAENEHGYRYHVRVFNSSVQGESAVTELRAALAHVDPKQFDAVVFIRGGGSKLDLEPYNDLELTRLVARLPIPVLTGIGHEVDVSVLDLIARGHQKTPTAVADFIVDKSLFFETALNGMLVSIHNSMLMSFSDKKEQLSAYVEMLLVRPIVRCQTRRGALHMVTSQLARRVTEKLVTGSKALDTYSTNLAILPRNKLVQMEAAKMREHSTALTAAATRGFQLLLVRLEGMKDTINLMAPDNLLLRGFSITRLAGKAVSNPGELLVGDQVETTFAKGTTSSTINTITTHG